MERTAGHSACLGGCGEPFGDKGGEVVEPAVDFAQRPLRQPPIQQTGRVRVPRG
ncbi:hypothetical protein [Streptomyces sp. NPDC055287]